MADHAMACEYLCLRSSSTALGDTDKLVICLDTCQRTLYLMGSRISEGVELCPYLYDPTFVRSTYIQITKVISDLPLLAYKQANLVKSVRRNFVANYPPVMQEHGKYHENGKKAR